jgi:hypothetical protein
MESKNLIKAGLLSLFLVATFIVSYENFWRNNGLPLSYNDDESLWSYKRKQVYQPPTSATVFIGSSRIKFDLDIDTWREQTGEDAVQLSLVGTSPLLVLENLADDENFRGKLIVGVTEILFFQPSPSYFHRQALKSLDFYEVFSPSHQAGFQINRVLESRFFFLEEKFSLNHLLKKLQIPNREGVKPEPIFPDEFEINTFDRQTYMGEAFVQDTAKINIQKRIWTMYGLTSDFPAIKGDTLEAFLHTINTAVGKIRNRGGNVLFVRPPSTGPVWEVEQANFPRELYWEKLLTATASQGVHFRDYPETSDLDCPEWSHLTREDAVLYTKHLVDVLENEKGWKFPKQPTQEKTAQNFP